MRMTLGRVGLVAAVALAALVASAAARAGNGDFDYIANPPLVTGPAMSTLKPHFPGVGNECSALFGAPPPLGCYDPTQIRNAYNVPSTLTGAGQTIIIVDAYGDPNIEQDLATFDEFFGVPDPPSFTVYHGSATQKAGPHDPAGWASETALDVEWSHAIAPGADLVLIEAPSSSGNAINTVERQIIPKYPGAIVSQSFGIPENILNGNGNNIQFQQAHQNYELLASLGDTVLASTGDFGATADTASNTTSYPASDPLVTGVGGTQGMPFPLGLCPSVGTDQCTYGGEEVWNEPSTVSVPVATGGGPSRIFSAPAFQAGLTGFNVRTTPDVSYNAAINGGVLIVQLPNIELIGGTSCGSPQWAGIFALANEARGLAGEGPIGNANQTLYSIYTSARYHTDFHDITVGNNTLGGQPVTGFSAGPGYDLATGIGTPNVANLLTDLK